ncbi:MAG: AMIN domain-containing protein [Desulfobacteraceae bacterium]|nr:N-acetylmuramoyl-L-alanine amidase [Desulfobacteraceae bacterium]MBC2756682.1 AMIN domain-containing protein [Desulfobacteraceae bacterium]
MSKRKTFITILLCCTVSVFWSCASSGSTSKNLFFQAEACRSELRKSPDKQKYRSYWFGCIRKFEAVHQQDPSGPWAAAGLFNMGSLYEELYSHSYKKEDRQKAENIYRQIVKEYPASIYKKRALAAIKNLPKYNHGSDDIASAKKKFFEAEASYTELLSHPNKQKFRSYWMESIKKFESVYRQDPSGPWAAAGLYMMGNLYEDLYKHSFKEKDKQKAKELFEKIVHQYPDSAYSKKAENKLKGDIQSLILSRETEKSNDKAASTKETTVSAEPEKENNSGLTTVTGIRYWSNPDYTRVVIDADRATSFQNNLLKKDPAIDKSHQRLYIDLKNSRLGNIKKTIPINDSLLKAARAGQYTPDTVRVVIDINSFEDYNIFSLPNPFRIVIDVRGQISAKKDIPKKDRNGQDTASIARQLALGVQRIVIDPGHGGKDFGAPGYFKGVHEKKVVLEIAKKLAEKIRQELGCEVILTREGDTYLTLEERTAIANTKRGDLFISIHANASRNKRAFGIETYFLNLTTDDESITVAARENATSKKNISELQTILNDLLQNAKINESSRLATYVQKELCSTLGKKYNRINNKGVKRAPFYVLIGAQMPAILIETSFISNKIECQRLKDAKYQSTLCDGIVSGIRKYIKETQPTAYFGAPADEGPKG